MDIKFEEYDVYRMHLLAKAIKEIDDKLNLLSEPTRREIDLSFQYIFESKDLQPWEEFL